MNYFKRKIIHKSHIDAVNKLRNLRSGGILKLLTKTSEKRQLKKQIQERTKSDYVLVKILIENVILARKINFSINSVVEIHNHMYAKIMLLNLWNV